MRTLLAVILFGQVVLLAQSTRPTAERLALAEMDRDLMDITVDRLHVLYSERRYTVAQVVQWHLDRIERYNGVYRAIQTVTAKAALTEAAREDAEAKTQGFKPGPLWGVPIVIKANASIAGLVTTDGWAGYMLAGHELVAPRDATMVAKFRNAGAIVI